MIRYSGSVELRPCEHCRRHVARDAPHCPFCNAPQSAAAERIVAQAARMSRAMIFAGVAACGSSPPAHRHAPPPPPPHDPVVVQQFATAPSPSPSKASVRGFVMVDGRPLTGVLVRARDENGMQLETTTGAKGEYAFIDIAPGYWQLTPDYELPSFRPRPPEYQSDSVVLADGANQRHDIQIQTPPPDDGPCCKPYGAPPARRRVV